MTGRSVAGDSSEGLRVVAIATGLIGDTLMRLPPLRALREHAPTAYIGMIVSPSVVPILEANPLIDVVFAYSKKMPLLEQISVLRRIRGEGFDVALDLYYGGRSAILAWLSGARRRIGPASGWLARRLLTDALPIPAADAHFVDRHLAIVRPLGVEAMDRRWEFPTPSGLEETVSRRLADLGLAGGPREGDVVICASASDVSKTLEPGILRDVATRIGRGELGPRRVLIEAYGQEALQAQVFRQAEGVFVLPSLSLLELGALFSRVALVMAGDTGPKHIALARCPRVLAFFLSTDPDQTRPCRAGYAELHAEVCSRQLRCGGRHKDQCALECRASLSADRIVASLGQLLREEAPTVGGGAVETSVVKPMVEGREPDDGAP